MAESIFMPGSRFATEVGRFVSNLHEDDMYQDLANGAEWAGFVLGGPDDEDAPQAWVIRLPAGFSVPMHWHEVHRLEIVLAGSYVMGEERKEYGAGTITFFPAGMKYGPFDAGPDGMTSIEIFSNSANVRPRFAEAPPAAVAESLRSFGMEPMVVGSG